MMPTYRAALNASPRKQRGKRKVKTKRYVWHYHLGPARLVFVTRHEVAHFKVKKDSWQRQWGLAHLDVVSVQACWAAWGWSGTCLLLN